MVVKYIYGNVTGNEQKFPESGIIIVNVQVFCGLRGSSNGKE